MAEYPSLEMMYEQDDRDYKRTAEEDDQEINKAILSYYKNAHKEEKDRGSDHTGPYYLYDDDDDDDFDEIKSKMQPQEEIKPKLTGDAAAADAVNKVLEEIIQLPALKNICDVHHLDQQILTKVLENSKNFITQQTLNQLAKRRRQLAEDNEVAASPVPLQAPPHDKVNNVSEETASKKICYAHDDDEEIRSKFSEERI